LDPNLAEAYVLLAEMAQEQWRWAEAETEYRRALELNPNDSDGYTGLAHWLLCPGRTGEALASAERARELDRPWICNVESCVDSISVPTL